MRLVLDPRMLADGVVFDGARRRLLILLARGRLVQELAASDWAIMNAEVDRTPGAEIGGRPVSQPDVTAMRAWQARLPPGAPDDLYLVASGALNEDGAGAHRDELRVQPRSAC